MYAGLILAAGQARRFGSDKRQALLPNGLTMLEHVIGQYQGALDTLWVVLPPHDDWGQTVCHRLGAIAVSCDLAAQGMGHSLAAGAQAVLSSERGPDWQGLLIGLADMPGVSSHHVETVLCALRAEIDQKGEQALVLPMYEGQAGHPRGIGRGLLPHLTTLQGDAGARQAFDWSQARRVDMKDQGACLDIDMPQDLTNWSGFARSPH
ncbi:MAG: NTP transferase domain-containing protein [Aquabacterium sp.]